MSNNDDHNRFLAKLLSSAISGLNDFEGFDVFEYGNDDGPEKVDIYIAKGFPYSDLATIATIDLACEELFIDSEVQYYGVNLCAATEGNINDMCSILSTCAFFIMKDKWEIYPGSIFPNVIENYDPSLKVKHVLFLSPFCWEGKLSSFFYRERKEIFLQAVPITQAELDFAIEHGTDILEEKLLSQAKSIFSLGRNSVIL